MVAKAGFSSSLFPPPGVGVGAGFTGRLGQSYCRD